ncbi:MAG: YtxH domain-containing protein [Bacteroidota bacterium]
MNRAGKWGLALGLATGAVLALTLTTRPGKRTRTESTKKTAKADIKATSLSNDDSEIHYV